MAMMELFGKKHAKYHTQIFFVIFSLILILTFLMVKSYIGLVFISLVYSVIIWPLYENLLKIIKKPNWLATPVAIFFSLLIVVLPSIIFLRTLIAQILEAVDFFQRSYSQQDLTKLITQLSDFLTKIPIFSDQLNQQQLLSTLNDLISPLRDFLLSSIWAVGNTSVGFIVSFLLMVILVFFILPNLKKLRNFLLVISPFSADATLQYLRRSYAMVMDTIKGTFVIGIVQGSVAGIFLAILGVPTPVFLSFLMMILSILPIVGTGFVMVPLAIVYALTGQWWTAILIFAWQMLVVGTVDNILRPLMVSKDANLHPALMMIAVLSGVKTFGFVGLLYGPLIMVILMTTLEVYKNEYRS